MKRDLFPATLPITSFSGPHRFLSTFYLCRVILDGKPYASVEHAYQAAKTHSAEERAAFLNPKLTPGGAKRLGRRLALRADWEAVKLDVMRDLVRQKFLDPDLRERLLSTGAAELIEGNTWNDRIWGMVEEDEGTWVGQNLLGKTLMEVRAEAAAQARGVARDDSVECHGLDTPDRVCFYEQDFYVLSNFSAFQLRWRGHVFDTSEAAYQYEKFVDTAPDVAASILHAPSAHEAFKLAERRKTDRRSDWDDVKVDIMREILRAKVQQHEYVRRKLLATGERELVENSWRDPFWGWGPNRDGRNMLGRLWMEVRTELTRTHRGA